MGTEAEEGMEAAMSEQRDFPGQNVAQQVGQKTGQPERLITPLENCTVLSDKIEKAIAAIKDELARVKV